MGVLFIVGGLGVLSSSIVGRMFDARMTALVGATVSMAVGALPFWMPGVVYWGGSSCRRCGYVSMLR